MKMKDKLSKWSNVYLPLNYINEVWGCKKKKKDLQCLSTRKLCFALGNFKHYNNEIPRI